MLVVDRVSSYMWDYYLLNRTLRTIIKILGDLFARLERQYGTKVKAVEYDNEAITVKLKVRE